MGQEKVGHKVGQREKRGKKSVARKVGQEKWGKKSKARKVGETKWRVKSGETKVGDREKWGETKVRRPKSGTRKVGHR